MDMVHSGHEERTGEPRINLIYNFSCPLLYINSITRRANDFTFMQLSTGSVPHTLAGASHPLFRWRI